MTCAASSTSSTTARAQGRHRLFREGHAVALRVEPVARRTLRSSRNGRQTPMPSRTKTAFACLADSPASENEKMLVRSFKPTEISASFLSHTHPAQGASGNVMDRQRSWRRVTPGARDRAMIVQHASAARAFPGGAPVEPSPDACIPRHRADFVPVFLPSSCTPMRAHARSDAGARPPIVRAPSSCPLPTRDHAGRTEASARRH